MSEAHLREALEAVRTAILEAPPEVLADTLWVATEPAETAVDLITAALERDPEQPSWTCFHCGETFTTVESARVHFGSDELRDPACLIAGSDGGLVGKIRELEDLLARYQAEDGPLERQIQVMSADHKRALRWAEEEGYAKALKEARVGPPGRGWLSLDIAPTDEMIALWRHGEYDIGRWDRDSYNNKPRPHWYSLRAEYRGKNWMRNNPPVAWKPLDRGPDEPPPPAADPVPIPPIWLTTELREVLTYQLRRAIQTFCQVDAPDWAATLAVFTMLGFLDKKGFGLQPKD